MGAAGTLMMFFPPTAAVGIGILVVGTIASTGGGIWYSFADDNELTMFLKNSPWGIENNNSRSYNEIEGNNKTYLEFLQKELGNND